MALAVHINKNLAFFIPMHRINGGYRLFARDFYLLLYMTVELELEVKQRERCDRILRNQVTA